MDNEKIKKLLKGNMKLDALAFFITPLIFLILVFATSVVVIAWQTSKQVELNIVANTVGQNAINSTFPNQKPIDAWLGIGNNIYSFDTFLPFVFYMIMIAIIFSAVLLDPDPLSWLVGVIYMPLIYYVNVYISNSAHGILTQPILANGIAKLPNSLVILAQLPLITFLFGLLYLIVLALRVYGFSATSQGQERKQQGTLR